jgi:hypothetical protein
MTPSLCPSTVRNTPCPHYCSLYTLNGLSKHVKNAHPPASLISQASFLSLQVSSILIFLHGSIPLFFGVGFRPDLVLFWGCLSFISCALICFIGSLEPSKTRLGKLFAYPLTELLET